MVVYLGVNGNQNSSNAPAAVPEAARNTILLPGC